jgi:hypothetical protein
MNTNEETLSKHGIRADAPDSVPSHGVNPRVMSVPKRAL